VAKEARRSEADLPSFVSIAPPRTLTPSALGPGFLGPLFSPMILGDAARSGEGEYAATPDQLLKVPDLTAPTGVDRDRAEVRLDLLRAQQKEFLVHRKDAPPAAHQAALDGAVRLMRPSAARAFDFDAEPAAVRDAYGRTLFGQGCLLARRLVERGVPF